MRWTRSWGGSSSSALQQQQQQQQQQEQRQRQQDLFLPVHTPQPGMLLHPGSLGGMYALDSLLVWQLTSDMAVLQQQQQQQQRQQQLVMYPAVLSWCDHFSMTKKLSSKADQRWHDLLMH
jgi:hypothetical protein